MPVGYTTRAEHLAWCRTRALGYVDGDCPGLALTRLCNDLDAHPETADRVPFAVKMLALCNGGFVTAGNVRAYVEGLV